MKFWNNEEELDALIDEAANEVEADKTNGGVDDAFSEENKPLITIIESSGSCKRGKWQDRINSTKAEYGRELERKKKLHDQTGNTDIFSPEDIDAMLYENETFRGKNVDLSQVQKYNQLAAAARALDKRHMDVVKTDCPPLPKGRAGYIGVDIKSVSFFADDVKNTLARMMRLCDSFSASSLDEGIIHLSFFVRNIRVK